MKNTSFKVFSEAFLTTLKGALKFKYLFLQKVFKLKVYGESINFIIYCILVIKSLKIKTS